MKISAGRGIALASLLVLLGVSSVSVMWQNVAVDFDSAATIARPPRILPDYSEVVIPPNIAPLNFVVDEEGMRYAARIHSDQGDAIELRSRSGTIVIPPSKWRQLLGVNRGRRLYCDIYVQGRDRQWSRFDSIVNTIAEEDVDDFLYYRLIGPIYIIRVNVAIHQRDLRSFRESVVVSNQSFGHKRGCINCHTFAPHHPDQMTLHSRGSGDLSHRSGMVVVRQGKVIKVDTRKLVRSPESERGRITKSLAGYMAWHPNGRLLAYSAGDMFQFFHAAGENRDVFDRESDLALYHADSNTVTTSPNISQSDRLETFPAWSPDGEYLYFCSTDPLPAARFREVRYDLMRVQYEEDTDTWGEVEPVLLAKDTGLSIAEPRVSPDGRWLLFCMSEYGAFPVFQPSSDLYLMDLTTRQYHRLDINSPRSESWHSWSSNSRWFAFASKRGDGVFGRVYFSYVDDQGRAHKPLLLPQKDPTFYDRFIKTYNAPELSRWPAPATGRDLARVICERD